MKAEGKEGPEASARCAGHPSSFILHPSRTCDRCAASWSSVLPGSATRSSRSRCSSCCTRVTAPLALDVLAPRWTLPLLERMPEVRRAIENPVGHGELRLAEQRRIARELAQERYEQRFRPAQFVQVRARPVARGNPRAHRLRRRAALGAAERRAPAGRAAAAADRPALCRAGARSRRSAASPPARALGLRMDETQRRATLAQARPRYAAPSGCAVPGSGVRAGKALAGALFRRAGAAARGAGLRRLAGRLRQRRGDRRRDRRR